MAAPLNKTEPYERNESVALLPDEAIRVWIKVADSVASEKQVPLASTKSALQFANEHLQSHKPARVFVEHCLHHVVTKLLNKDCQILEDTNYNDTEECLKLAAIIAAKDIGIQLQSKGIRKLRLSFLATLLDRSARYYKDIDGMKTRLQVIDAFQTEGGFSRLANYLLISKFSSSTDRNDIIEFFLRLVVAVSDLVEMNSPKALSSASTIEILRLIDSDVPGLESVKSGPTLSAQSVSSALSRVANCLANLRAAAALGGSDKSVVMPDFTSGFDERKKDATLVATAVFRFLQTISLEDLNDKTLETFGRALPSTGELLVHVSRQDSEVFERFCRDLVLRLITSQSEELRSFGWKQISLLVARAVKHRPPARSIVVSNTGTSVVNGVYRFAGSVDMDGWAEASSVYYKRTVPETAREAAGGIFVMVPFRINDSKYYRWHFSSSEVSSSYYTAESSSCNQPPEKGWKAKTSAVSSTPSLRCQGLVVPVGQENKTLEHQLAEWTIKNKVIEIFYEGTDCFKLTADPTSTCMFATPLIKLMALMSDQNEYRLQPSHALLAWNTLDRCEDPHAAASVCVSLASVFHFLPDNIAMCLIGAMQECLASQPEKVHAFLAILVSFSIDLEEPVDLALGAPRLSDEVRVEMKKILWSARTRDNTVLEGLEPEKHETWLKWETFRRSCKDAKQSRTQVEALDTKKTPKKPIVALLDPKGRRIQVSIPVESESGGYYVGADIYASCDGHEGEGVDLTIATIERDAIEQCLRDCNDRVVVEAVLPHTGVWNISWRGLILRKEIIKTPRSAETVVDFTVRDREQQKQQLAEIEAVDELARQHAGDIQSTIRKLRGPCSGQMEVETRFSLLYTAVVRGRSTLSKLTCLVETNGEDEASVSGVSVLSDALAEAHLPMKELEAALKVCNRKDRVKGFKTRITSLLESGDAASWIESVSRDDLESLGGDANRLYQLLVESKSSMLDLQELESASARTDLFSKKQVKALVKLASETRAVEQSELVQVKAEVNLHHKNSVKAVARVESEKASPEMIQHAVPAETREETNDITKRIVATSTPPSLADDFPLLTFLKEHDDCLKCSPEAFCRFLVDSEDIVSLDDLADAIGDDEYLQGILQQGGGGGGGLKGFKRAAFKKAVLVASGRRDGVVAATSMSSSENKENVHPSSVLICPLSRILMTKEPVLAADGHTYELAAIAEWFDKQESEIKAAKRRIAAGSNSKKLRDIVQRGIVSPVTHERMESLALTSNKALRAMARDATKANNKRVPFGSLSR